jgi:hypothetical protein
MLGLFGGALVTAAGWEFSAKIAPFIVGTIALTATALSLFNDLCRKPEAATRPGLTEQAQHQVGQRIHMDLASDTAHLPVRTVVTRAARFFGYLIGFMGSMAVIGLIPTVALFVLLFMRLEGRERWSLVIPYAVILVLAITIVFDLFMAVPWPATLLGELFPFLKIIPSV